MLDVGCRSLTPTADYRESRLHARQLTGHELGHSLNRSDLAGIDHAVTVDRHTLAHGADTTHTRWS